MLGICCTHTDRTCAGLAFGACALLAIAGCTSTGVRVIPAQRPQTETAIDHFELHSDQAAVFGRSEGHLLLRSQHGQEAGEICVRPGEYFWASGFNCREQWVLIELARGHAVFDVHGKYYGCTDPLAILFNIPSRLSHWTVVVCPLEGSAKTEGQPTSRPRWF